MIVAIPLIGALAAVGLQLIHDRRSFRVSLVSAALLVTFCWLEPGDDENADLRRIGRDEKTRAAESAFDDVGAVNRLLDRRVTAA